MRDFLKTIPLGVALLVTGTCVQAQFTAGDLVVLRDGTGTGTLTSAAAPLFLDEYTTSPSGYVSSDAIPSSGSSALVNSGSASSEGEISLSANDQYIVLAGYNANAGTASIASSTSTADPRALATVDAGGNYNLATTSSSAFSGNNIRSGTTDGNGNYWSVGANTGVYYMGSGTAGAVSATSANNRLVQDIGGNLFFSTGSGSTRGIYEVSGAPTSGANTAVNIINASTLGSVSPYGFAFNPGMTVAYIADSDAYTSATGLGGIEKWMFNGSAWAFQYSLPTVGAGADGLAVDFSGANPTIYATSADGTSLFDIVDSGTTSTDTLLDTASANEAFRGLTFAPSQVPEPSVLALLGLGFPGLCWRLRRGRKS